MSAGLTHYDLADIRMRHALGQTTRDDVEALLGEVGDVRDALKELAEQFELTDRADPVATVLAVGDRLAEVEGETVERDKLELERAILERGVSAVLRAMRDSGTARKLMGEPSPLATADELCPMCSAGHADEFGLCPHGGKIPELCVETTGPTQSGLVNLVVYVVPLMQLLAYVAKTVRPNKNKQVQAKRLRNGC